MLVGGDATAIKQLWLFIVAPVLGGVFGACAYCYISNACCKDDKKKK